MYIPSNPATLTAETANPLLLYAKRLIRSLSREQRIVFFLKLIKYSLDNRDLEVVIKGLDQLCVMIPELKHDLAIANRTYLGEDEGERVYMLFKHAFRRVKNTEKAPLLWRKKEPAPSFFERAAE